MNEINGKYSVYNKTFSFELNGEEHNLSNLVPEDVWNIGERKFPTHPLDDWEIRKKLRKIFIKYFKKNIDKNIKARDIYL